LPSLPVPPMISLEEDQFVAFLFPLWTRFVFFFALSRDPGFHHGQRLFLLRVVLLLFFFVVHFFLHSPPLAYFFRIEAQNPRSKAVSLPPFTSPPLAPFSPLDHPWPSPYRADPRIDPSSPPYTCAPPRPTIRSIPTGQRPASQRRVLFY